MRFDRQELAGSLGDLGTLLPITIALIQLNGMDATAVFLCIALFYVLSGLYFGITVPVQPMKVVGAYAISQGLSPTIISTSGALLAVMLLLLVVTGAVHYLSIIVPRPVIRGVQLTTGVVLLTRGIQLMLGTSSLQTVREASEPFLTVQSVGPIPIGWLIGALAFALILLFIKNRVAPAALVVIVMGALAGLALGGWNGLASIELGLSHPELLPYGLPSASDLVIALTLLALPQMPMTIGNAVLAQADLTKEYFGPEGARRSTVKALTLSMALANIAAAAIGGMPMCHGAGGLAAHYQFGARTAGSNLMIGLFFAAIAIFLGSHATAVLGLIPFAVLGVLLAFAGSQLALVILDVKERKDLFVVVIVLGVSLASNLAVGFACGLVLAFLLRHPKLEV